jgi:hypothetical protein
MGSILAPKADMPESTDIVHPSTEQNKTPFLESQGWEAVGEFFRR